MLYIGWYKLKCITNGVECEYLAKVIGNLGIVRSLSCENNICITIISCKAHYLNDIILSLTRGLRDLCYINEAYVLDVNSLCWYNVIRDGIYVGFNKIKCLETDVNEVKLLMRMEDINSLSMLSKIFDLKYVINRVKEIYGVDPSSLIRDLDVNKYRINVDNIRGYILITFKCGSKDECIKVLRYVNLINAIGVKNPICSGCFSIELIK